MAQPTQKPGASAQDYATPDAFIQAVKRRLRIDRFSHDFAADGSNKQAPTFFDQETDALSVPRWELTLRECGAVWGWLNPPYADIGPWARRCLETSQAGGHMALLVPAGVGANWYRDYIHRRALVLALNGRLAFMPDKPKWLYPKDCILCLFGPTVVADFDVWRWKDQR